MDSFHPPLHLQSLPNEILLRIIESEISHSDLENIALCSKTLFDLARPARERHLFNKRRFSTIIVGDAGLGNGVDQPMVLNDVDLSSALGDLLANRAAATEYCTTLRIHALDDEEFFTKRYNDRNDREAMLITQKLAPQLFTLIQQAPFTTYDRWLFSHLRDIYEFLYEVPLILLYQIKVLELSNISSLFLNRCDGFKMVGESHHHLEQVRLFGNIEGYLQSYSTDFEALRFLAQFPSITSIHGVHLSHPTSGLPLPHLEHVTDLHFESSGIDVEFLVKLLGTTKGLKNFFYETDNRFRFTYVYGLWQTIWALRMSASKTLESLTLVDPSNTIEAREAYKSYPLSLRDFAVLKHVSVDCSLFRKPFVEDGHRDWYRLVEVLPQTLETLELFRPASGEELSSIFGDLVELKGERLPNLKKISVDGEVHLEPDLVDDCERLDIELIRISQPSKKDPHLSR